jgi:SP family facilitated glucose transporter-like MFS transporter 1
MYITELSPVSIRGSVGCLFQLGVTLSITLSQVLGLTFVFGNAKYWPLLLGNTRDL